VPTVNAYDGTTATPTEKNAALEFLFSLFSIRYIFLLLLLFFIVAVSVIVWSLGYRGSTRSINLLVTKIQQSAIDRAEENINSHFARIERLASQVDYFAWTNLDDLETVFQNQTMLDTIRSFFFSILQSNLDVMTSVNCLRKDGALIAVSYDLPSSTYSHSVNQQIGRVTGNINQNVSSLPWLAPAHSAFKNYTTIIPTYNTAVSSAPASGMFFPLSADVSNPSSFVTSIAKPFYKRGDGSLVGTLNIVFQITILKRLFTAINPSKYGFTIVMQNDGYLVGDSTPYSSGALATCNTTSPVVLKLCSLIKSRSSDRDIAKGIQNFPTSGMNMKVSGDTMKIIRKTVTRGLQTWNVFVGLSDAEFSGPVVKNSYRVIWVSIIIVVAALVIAILVIFVFLRTLARLAQCFHDIQQMRLDSKSIKAAVNRRSAIYELRVLEGNFRSMLLTIKSFQKYIPKRIVEDLIKNQREAALGLSRRTCSVFFMDVEGFTSLSEKLQPEALVNIMCDMFNMSSKIIVENDGVIDKYIGDCVMAFFNAPAKVKGHASKAIRAAIEIQTELKAREIDYEKKGLPALRTRIGINTGKVLFGNFGSEERLSYTVIGDPVNTASRLESINKLFGTNILISEETYKRSNFHPENEHYKPMCRRVENAKLKGKDQATMIYQVFTEAYSEESLEEYDVAFNAFQIGDFHQAHDLFTSINNYQLDTVIQRKIQQCEEYKVEYPENWDGSIVLTEK
jgi:class 3 adenylate cyclase